MNSKTQTYRIVTPLRLNLLRGYYALMAFGTATVFWPSLVNHTAEWGIANGAQYALLATLSPLSLLGLRYPLKMLPVVIFEFLWKALWFLFVVAPLYRADRMTDEIWSNAFACMVAIVLTPIVLPWGHVWRNYGIAPADPWRGRTLAAELGQAV